MKKNKTSRWLALAVVAAVLASPVLAGGREATREEVKIDEVHRIVVAEKAHGPFYEESEDCEAYDSVRGDAGAVMLGISASDDATELVTPSFSFMWFGDTPIASFNVSTNGQINIDSSDTSTNCCSADPVAPGNYPDPRIAVVQEDLDPGDYGEIWVLDDGASIVVDWSGVAYFAATGLVDAQAELYADGTIEVRWGTVGGDEFDAAAMGVEDPPLGHHTPATGGPFDATGVVDSVDPPVGPLCRRFTPIPPTGACCTDGQGLESECIEVTEDDCDLAGPDGGLFLGQGTSCDDVEDCVALVVTMDSMVAQETEGGVLIRWSTALELDTVGFRILRQSGDGREKAIEILRGFIPASGSGTVGSSYEFLDDTRGARSADVYFIEDVDIFNRTTRHGPIPVQRGSRVRGR